MTKTRYGVWRIDGKAIDLDLWSGGGTLGVTRVLPMYGRNFKFFKFI